MARRYGAFLKKTTAQACQKTGLMKSCHFVACAGAKGPLFLQSQEAGLIEDKPTYALPEIPALDLWLGPTHARAQTHVGTAAQRTFPNGLAAL